LVARKSEIVEVEVEVSVSGGQKPQFWANFDIFGAPVPTRFTDEGYIWCASVL